LYIIDDSDDSLYVDLSKVLKNKLDFELVQNRGPDWMNPSRAVRVFKSTILGISSIPTKYVSFCSDDDFIFPKFIEKGINFLEKNPEFSTFIGPEINLQYSQDLKTIGKKIKVWNGCEFLDPLDRLLDYLRRPTLAYYGVCRTSNFKNFDSIPNQSLFQRTKGTLSFFDEEIPWVSLCYLAGKIRYEPSTLQGIRGIHNSADRMGFQTEKNLYLALGPIEDLLEHDSTIVLNETIHQLTSLIVKKSIYPEDYIKVNITKWLWHHFIKYSPKDPTNLEKLPLIAYLKNQVISPIRKFRFFIHYFKESRLLNSKDLKKYCNI
jgi:hypothetical protein